MNTSFILQSTIEVILAVGFIWGLFNESKLAKLERRLFAKIKAVCVRQSKPSRTENFVCL